MSLGTINTPRYIISLLFTDKNASAQSVIWDVLAENMSAIENSRLTGDFRKCLDASSVDYHSAFQARPWIAYFLLRAAELGLDLRIFSEAYWDMLNPFMPISVDDGRCVGMLAAYSDPRAISHIADTLSGEQEGTEVYVELAIGLLIGSEDEKWLDHAQCMVTRLTGEV